MTGRRPLLERIWRRWIDGLVRCYPPRFRADLGADLSAQYTGQPPAGILDLARRSVAAARDLGLGGIGSRLDDLRAGRSPRRAGAARRWLSGLLPDLRHGARALRRQPAYAAAVILTLALASGLTTAVFGIYDATLARDLPFPDHDRVVSIGSRWTGFSHASVSIPEYLDYRERARTLGAIAAIRTVNLNLTSASSDPERILGARVTASYFDVMKAAPVLGRPFTADEDRPGGPDIAVIGSSLWRSRLAGRTSIIGDTILLDDRRVTVVGVMPPAFRFPDRETQVWLPLAVNEAAPGGRGAHNRQVVARLAPGATLEAAQSEMDRIAIQLQHEFPSNYPDGSGWGISVSRLRDRLVGEYRSPLQMLLGAVLFVLVMAAANVSGLMLARATGRQLEFAARAALGASRLRLLRLVMMEGLIAGLAGAALGLGVAAGLIRLLEGDLPPAVSQPASSVFDLRVLLFAFGVTGLASITAALYAAARSSRTGAADALRTFARASATRATRRFRTALVVGQVALAFLLLGGAGLAVSSFLHLTGVDPGLRVDDVFTARLSLPASRYETGQEAAAFFGRLLGGLDDEPGVRQAGAVSILPLGGSDTDYNFGIEGYVAAPGQEPNAQARIVAGRYFEALGVPLLQGRAFDARDTHESGQVAIVSRALARQYWGEGSSVGRRLKLWSIDDPGPWRTIVGVVGDVRHFGLSSPEAPMLYFPLSQVPQRTMTVLVRAEPGVAGGRLIAEGTRRLDPSQPVFSSLTMSDWLSQSLAGPRFNVLLLSAFATAALLLAVFGLHGAIAFIVASRRRDLGIRLALGARPRRLAGELVGSAVRLTLMGLAIGVAAAAALASSAGAIVHGTQPVQPIVYAVAAAVLLAAAILASTLPARRVLRLDVTGTLRAPQE